MLKIVVCVSIYSMWNKELPDSTLLCMFRYKVENWIPDSQILDSSEYLTTVGIRKPTLRKPETFENQTFWRSVFKWSGFQMVGTSYNYSFSARLSHRYPQGDFTRLSLHKYFLLLLFGSRALFHARTYFKNNFSQI